jgi:hypothetical protein
MQDTGLVVTAALCFVGVIFAFQQTIHKLKTKRVLACGQSVFHNYFKFFKEDYYV